MFGAPFVRYRQISFEAFPTGIRRETAAKFLRQRAQAGNHVFGPAAPRIVQGTATEWRVTGAKDHRAVDEVGIVRNALAQTGDAHVGIGRIRRSIISGVGSGVAGALAAFSALPSFQT